MKRNSKLVNFLLTTGLIIGLLGMMLLNEVLKEKNYRRIENKKEIVSITGKRYIHYRIKSIGDYSITIYDSTTNKNEIIFAYHYEKRGW